MLIKRCKCKKGECKQLAITPPKAILKKIREFSFNKEKYGIAIDDCLVDEIRLLWKFGVVTTTCCCGHNEFWSPPHIGVTEETKEIMEGLGYRRTFNPCKPESKCFFYPLSIKFTVLDYIREFIWKVKYRFTSLTQ